MTEYPGVRVLPIQIRADLVIQIAHIPLDLTKAEAERICRIVMALVQPEGKNDNG